MWQKLSSKIVSTRFSRQSLALIMANDTGAGLSYVPAIRAALKAGLANILITDHMTAQLLLSSE